jgi:hypothetical protein
LTYWEYINSLTERAPQSPCQRKRKNKKQRKAQKEDGGGGEDLGQLGTHTTEDREESVGRKKGLSAASSIMKSCE